MSERLSASGNEISASDPRDPGDDDSVTLPIGSKFEKMGFDIVLVLTKTDSLPNLVILKEKLLEP